MEVSVGPLTKCCIIAILFHSARTLKVDMSNCTVAMDSKPCIAYDSTSDIHNKGDNASKSIFINLPYSVLTELLSDPRKVSIVTAGGENVTFGDEILRNQDRATWTFQIHIQPDNNGYGKLHLILNILGVQYSDEQWLHVEIRLDYVTFKTSDQIWFQVNTRATNDEDTDNQPQGGSLTTKNTSATEDPVAKRNAKNEELERENKALQHDVNHYRDKYETCLENKYVNAHNPITLDLMTFFWLIFFTAAIFFIAIFYKKKKVDKWTIGETNDQWKTVPSGRTLIFKKGNSTSDNTDCLVV